MAIITERYVDVTMMMMMMTMFVACICMCIYIYRERESIISFLLTNFSPSITRANDIVTTLIVYSTELASSTAKLLKRIG